MKYKARRKMQFRISGTDPTMVVLEKGQVVDCIVISKIEDIKEREHFKRACIRHRKSGDRLLVFYLGGGLRSALSLKDLLPVRKK